MIYGITLILLSTIAVPSLLLSRRPDAKELLEKVAPYQGWIGVVFCLFGIWGIIVCVLNIGWMSIVPIWWLTLLVGSVVEAVLGFMLGYNLINQYVLSKNANAEEKGKALQQKLSSMQSKVGVLGIFVGLWMIIASIMWTV